MSNWIRLVHDDRGGAGDRENPNDGFTYFCKAGHSWFLPFTKQEELRDNGVENNCPECDAP